MVTIRYKKPKPVDLAVIVMAHIRLGKVRNFKHRYASRNQASRLVRIWRFYLRSTLLTITECYHEARSKRNGAPFWCRASSRPNAQITPLSRTTETLHIFRLWNGWLKTVNSNKTQSRTSFRAGNFFWVISPNCEIPRLFWVDWDSNY